MFDDLYTFVRSHQAWISPAILVGWVGTIIKLRADRRKWRLEKEKHIGEQLKQLHEHEESHREADKRYADCSRAFLAVIEAPLTDQKRLSDARDDLCRALNDLVSLYVAHFEFYCLVFRDDSDRLSSLCDSTVRDLRIWQVCQKNVNNPNVIGVVCRERFRISKHSLMPIRHALSRMRPSRDAKSALEVELDRVIATDIR